MTRALDHLVVAICLVVSAAAAFTDNAPVRTTPFPDVPKTHWAYGAVDNLREKGILRGYPPEAPKSAPAPKKAPQPRKKRRSA